MNPSTSSLLARCQSPEPHRRKGPQSLHLLTALLLLGLSLLALLALGITSEGERKRSYRRVCLSAYKDLSMYGYSICCPYIATEGRVGRGGKKDEFKVLSYVHEDAAQTKRPYR